MKRSTTIALALATALSGSLAAYAQTEQPNVHHHSLIHRHYPPHHPRSPSTVAHEPGATAERAGAADQERALSTNQMFQPYAAPGDGDDNGLSRDPDDCMKGCIGGNPG